MPNESDSSASPADIPETKFLSNSRIEIVRPLRAPIPQHVLFDFDGTLSLIREGWPEVMIPMMVEFLQETGTDETVDSLGKIAGDFVMELNGKQTIYQMIRLADEISKRGGSPKEPLEYKEEYHRRLMERINVRRDDLRSGKIAKIEMVVPGSFELLAGLQQKDVTLYLASGTDENYVKEEVALLGLDEYFEGRVYGAQDDYKSFSKAMIIERILTEHNVDGSSLLGFGDGYVEIENVKTAGGTAVGVASDESGRSGEPDAWKRNRLIGVGADLIVPDFREHERLLDYLWTANH